MTRPEIVALGVLGFALAYLVGAFDSLDLVGTPSDEQAQGPTLFDQAVNNLDPLAWNLSDLYSPLTDPMQDPNVQAFLRVIRYAEGTAGVGGYNAIFRTAAGPNTFSSYADHPRVAKRFTNKDGAVLWTTAAGAYQAMAKSRKPDGTYTKVDTWGDMQTKLGLTDFSPDSQDRFAVGLIDKCGALSDVRAGRFDAAITKCKGTWASLPGAGYAQPEKSLPELRSVFAQAGGTITTG